MGKSAWHVMVPAAGGLGTSLTVSVAPCLVTAVVTTFASLQPYSPKTATSRLWAKSTLARLARAGALSRLPNAASAAERLAAT